jgi:hypothetical protein
MGAVDRTDMMIGSIEYMRKSLKWYRKFFLHLLDITLLNSHAVFNVRTGQNISTADFQLQLIREIIQKYHVSRQSSKRGRPSAGDQPPTTQAYRKTFCNPCTTYSKEEVSIQILPCVFKHSNWREEKTRDPVHVCQM